MANKKHTYQKLTVGVFFNYGKTFIKKLKLRKKPFLRPTLLYHKKALHKAQSIS